MSTMLSDQDITTIQTILSEQLNLAQTEIHPESGIIADLGADSLDVAEIMMKLEEQFNLTIPDENLDQIITVEDLYQIVSDLLGSTRPESS